jgi:hypothetical protein
MPIELTDEARMAIAHMLATTQAAFEAGELEGLIIIPIRADTGGVGILAGPTPLISHQLRMAELNLMLHEISEAQKRAQAAQGIFIHTAGNA